MRWVSRVRLITTGARAASTRGTIGVPIGLGGMDKGVVGKAKGVEAEVFLTSVQETLAEACLGDVLGMLAASYLAGVLGLEPEEAWWQVQKNTPAWRAVRSYEFSTWSWQLPHGKGRKERAWRCHG